MGKTIHLDKVREFAAMTPAFSARDVEMIVGDRAYALQMLHNLCRVGEFHRIAKGWYSLSDDPIVSVFAFKPAYVGLEEALGIHGLWEQETNVVLVSPRKVRPGVRTVLGSKVFIHRIEPKRFFGYDFMKLDGYFVPVSDVEKTLIDLFYFGKKPDREVLAEAGEKIDKKKLGGYLQSYEEALARRVDSALAGHS